MKSSHHTRRAGRANWFKTKGGRWWGVSWCVGEGGIGGALCLYITWHFIVQHFITCNFIILTLLHDKTSTWKHLDILQYQTWDMVNISTKKIQERCLKFMGFTTIFGALFILKKQTQKIPQDNNAITTQHQNKTWANFSF